MSTAQFNPLVKTYKEEMIHIPRNKYLNKKFNIYTNVLINMFLLLAYFT